MEQGCSPKYVSGRREACRYEATGFRGKIRPERGHVDSQVEERYSSTLS